MTCKGIAAESQPEVNFCCLPNIGHAKSRTPNKPGLPFIASIIKLSKLHFIYFLRDLPLYSSTVEGANY